MKFKIRRATLNDSQTVNLFLTKLIHDEKRCDININENCIVTCLYENLMSDDNNCILVAEYNDKLVGYIYGYIENNGDAYINLVARLEAIFVEEKYRNNGLGTMLVDSFKAWAKFKKTKYIELKVCNGNERAIALYKKNKFAHIKSIMVTSVE